MGLSRAIHIGQKERRSPLHPLAISRPALRLSIGAGVIPSRRAVAARRDLGQAAMQPLTQLIRTVLTVGSALSRDDRTSRGDACEAGQTGELP